MNLLNHKRNFICRSIIRCYELHFDHNHNRKTKHYYLQVENNSSAPLWPIVEKEEKLLLLRVHGSSDVSAPFLYTEQHTSCLKLGNTVSGWCYYFLYI